MVDNLERWHTVTSNYDAQELKQLRQEIKEKTAREASSWGTAFQDNAPSHTSQVCTVTARECGFKSLPHPPYTPDLTPTDSFLFPKLKSFLRGKPTMTSCVPSMGF